MKKHISRRDFIKMAVVAGGASVLAACCACGNASASGSGESDRSPHRCS